MVNFIKFGGGDPLCTLHREEGLYSVQLGYMQGVDERLPFKKVNQVPVYASYTGRTVSYSLLVLTSLVTVLVLLR